MRQDHSLPDKAEQVDRATAPILPAHIEQTVRRSPPSTRSTTGAQVLSTAP
jgi:hypothetical protein